MLWDGAAGQTHTLMHTACPPLMTTLLLPERHQQESLSALPPEGWADLAQLKAHPLPAVDESRSRTYSRQWMSVSYVHALLCTWQGKAQCRMA